MLKAGIFVDTENMNRNGGRQLRYDVLKTYVATQGAEVVRANAYLAIDEERENKDPLYARKKSHYRALLRQYGFKLTLKPVKRFWNEDGELVTKANADLELAVDALLQSTRLDYVVLATGDGDFTHLVNALQNSGCRVDVIGLHNVSSDLRQAADNFRSGFLVPGLVPTDEGRYRGTLVRVVEDRYFGFIRWQRSLRSDDVEDVFVHGTEIENGTVSAAELTDISARRNIIEFSVAVGDDGKQKAVNARWLRPEQLPVPRSRDSLAVVSATGTTTSTGLTSTSTSLAQSPITKEIKEVKESPSELPPTYAVTK